MAEKSSTAPPPDEPAKPSEILRTSTSPAADNIVIAVILVAIFCYIFVRCWVLFMWYQAVKGRIGSKTEMVTIEVLIVAAVAFLAYLCRKNRGLLFWILLFLTIGLAGSFLWVEWCLHNESALKA